MFLFRKSSVSSIYTANDILSDVTRKNLLRARLHIKRNVDAVLDLGSGKMMKEMQPVFVSPLPTSLSLSIFSFESLFSPHASAFPLETVHGALQLTSSISCINVKQPFLPSLL